MSRTFSETHTFGERNEDITGILLAGGVVVVIKKGSFFTETAEDAHTGDVFTFGAVSGDGLSLAGRYSALLAVQLEQEEAS